MESNSFARKTAITTLALMLAVGVSPADAMAAAAESGTATLAVSSGSNGGQGGTPPSMPSGGGSSQGGGGGFAPGGGGANTMNFSYTGSYAGALVADGAAVDSASQSYTADTSDQNAALADNGGVLTVSDGAFVKSGDDSNGDNCNFYGVNSILLAVGSSSRAYVSGSSLSATSEGSNGIFATDGAIVYAEGDTIDTTAGNSRGLDATYDGTIIADALTIATQGDHCAAIATDRGGGTISCTGSTLSTAGSGSPLLYSTGDIEVDGVTGTTSGSQIAGLEGLNTILIANSELSSTNTGRTGSDPIADGVIIYQSTSGDAESTTGEAATFDAVGSTLRSAIASGAMFYCTNTSGNIVLEDTVLDFDSTAANLLTVAGNDSNNWGTAGSNGATVNFTGIGETLSGNVEADTISTLGLYLLEGTTWSGAASVVQNTVNTKASDTPLTINVDSTSTWTVTGDSTVSALNVASGGKVVDASGKTVTIVENGRTVVAGDSALTVTVTGSYGTAVSTGSVNELSADHIDRTAFDAYYGTSTAFGSGSEAYATASTSASVTNSVSAASSSENVDQTDTSDSASSANVDSGSTGNLFTRIWDTVKSWFGF